MKNIIHKLYFWLIVMGLILVYLDIFGFMLDRTIYLGSALVVGGMVIALIEEINNNPPRV